MRSYPQSAICDYESENFHDFDVDFVGEERKLFAIASSIRRLCISELQTEKKTSLFAIRMEFRCSEVLVSVGKWETPKFYKFEVAYRREGVTSAADMLHTILRGLSALLHRGGMLALCVVLKEIPLF
jgi:hypothetical protein